MRLSDTIEQFIKMTLMQEETEVELKRNELAEYFRCAPSQITYVLSTRFTPARGYVIESHRGGGGSVHIYRITHREDNPYEHFEKELSRPLNIFDATGLIFQLKESGLVTASTAALMQSAVSDKALSLPIPVEFKNQLRSGILREMLREAAKQASSRHDG